MAIADHVDYDYRQYQNAVKPLPSGRTRRQDSWVVPKTNKAKWRLRLLPVRRQPVSIEARFRQLAITWRTERRGMSSTSGILGCRSYRHIVALGLESPENLKKVITLLLFELQTQPDFWFSALRELTDVDPVPDKDRGNIKRMADAWVRWGQQQEYLPRSGAGSNRRNSWDQEVLAALDELRKYPVRPDSWSPRRPSFKVLSLAKQIVSSVKRKDVLIKPRIWATPDGGISIGWRRDRRSVDFEILSDGSIHFAKREQDKPTTGGEINRSTYQVDVNKVLGWLLV